MGYRDETAALRERVDQLELSLAKTTGRAMLLEEQRDAAVARLDALTGDPRALARAKSRNTISKLPFRALRVAGAFMLSVGTLPLVVTAIAFFFNEPGLGLSCSVVPALIILGTMALKLPEVVTWLQVRDERKRAVLEAQTRYRARARVELNSPGQVEPEAESVQAAQDARERMRR